MILAGDVGGTKTRLALYEVSGGQLMRRVIQKYDSRAFPTLKEIVQDFLTSHSVNLANNLIKAACFGIPGPVVAGVVKTTNLPWQLSERELSESLKIPKVRLYNDLVVTAAAIPHFSESDLLVLHPGAEPREKNVYAMCALGTGLGQAYLHMVNGQAEIIASEGGHTDFAPTDDMQIELLKYLRVKFADFNRVSCERLLCGPGLRNIYEFLRDSGHAQETPELKARMLKEDAGAVITQTGQEGGGGICSQALDIFSTILGTVAGNMVLSCLATGGVYLGGGVAPKILRKLKNGFFLNAYLNKRPHMQVVNSTPVYVVLDDEAAVLGSASLAARLLK